jgi:tripartite-type tricarboxylate transporter receptor subunit TctC
MNAIHCRPRHALRAALWFFLFVPALAPAQGYPTRPITLVLPFPPGGLADLVARRVSQKVSDDLKQPIVIESKAGGGGTIGPAYVKGAAPDGYTLLMANNSTQAINVSLMPKLQYDPVRDFAPITMLVSTSHVLVVPQASPAKSVGSLVALAKASPQGLTYASAGIGGGGHLLGEMLKTEAGIELHHVPFKGAAPAMIEVLAGRIDLYFEAVALAVPRVKEGRIRALATTARKRLPLLPEVPTMAEAGFPNVQADAWFALFAPAGTPSAIIRRLNGAFGAALRDPEVAKPLLDNGLELIPGTPEKLGATVTADIARYGKLIRAIGATAE